MKTFPTIDYPLKLIGASILRCADYGTALKNKGIRYRKDDFFTEWGGSSIEASIYTYTVSTGQHMAVEFTFTRIEDHSCLVVVWEKAENEVEELKQVLVSSEIPASIITGRFESGQGQ